MIISETGAAQVCDYDLTLITWNPAFAAVETPGVAGSPRWLAPEIIGSEKRVASKPADVFSFAMLAFEVFSGKVPFHDLTNGAVVVQILGGKRPVKPPTAEQLGLTTEMWGFIEKCWSANPSERPTMDEVVRTWGEFVGRCVVPSASRPSTPTPASRCQSSLRDSPGKSPRHTRRIFAAPCSSPTPRLTGSRPLCPFCRRRPSRSMRTTTPHRAVPRSRTSGPAAPLRSGLSRAPPPTRVSSVDLDWEGSEGLRMYPSGRNRSSLRVHLLKYSFLFASLVLRAQIRERLRFASSLSLKALLPSIAAAIGTYHLLV